MKGRCSLSYIYRRTSLKDWQSFIDVCLKDVLLTQKNLAKTRLYPSVSDECFVGLDFQLLFCGLSSLDGARTAFEGRRGWMQKKNPLRFWAAFDVRAPVWGLLCNMYGLFSLTPFLVVACCNGMLSSRNRPESQCKSIVEHLSSVSVRRTCQGCLMWLLAAGSSTPSFHKPIRCSESDGKSC